MSIIIKGATILSQDSQVGDFEKGDVLIKGNKIESVGIDLPIPSEALVIDGSNRILIPGFVDCHRHAWEGALRRIHPNSSTLFDYIDATHGGFKSAFRPEDVYAGTLNTAVSCVDAGITTVIDNMHCYLSHHHGLASINAWARSGVRSIVAVEQISRNAPSKSASEIKEDFAKLQAHAKQKSPNNSVEVGLFSDFGDVELQVANEMKIRIVCEVLDIFNGDKVVDAGSKGYLSPLVTFNHLTNISDESWDTIKQHGVQINICPRSDSQWALGRGVHAFQDAKKRGIEGGISVDNEVAYSGDMFSEMKVLSSIQRAFVTYDNSSKKENSDKESEKQLPVNVEEILRWATIGGARACGLGDKIGSITPGKEADMVLIRSDDLNLYPSNNAAGTVVLAADRANVDTVIIGGVIKKQGGKLVGIEQSEVKTAVDESLAYLFKATNYKLDTVAKQFKKVGE